MIKLIKSNIVQQDYNQLAFCQWNRLDQISWYTTVIFNSYLERSAKPIYICIFTTMQNSANWVLNFLFPYFLSKPTLEICQIYIKRNWHQRHKSKMTNTCLPKQSSIKNTNIICKIQFCQFAESPPPAHHTLSTSSP